MYEDAKERVRSFMDQLYAKSQDPDEYFLHQKYDKVLLAGVCILGWLLELKESVDYYYYARTELDKDPKLGKRLLTLPLEEAIKEAAGILAETACNVEESSDVRHQHWSMLGIIADIVKITDLPGAEEVGQIFDLVDRKRHEQPYD